VRAWMVWEGSMEEEAEAKGTSCTSSAGVSSAVEMCQEVEVELEKRRKDAQPRKTKNATTARMRERPQGTQ
jgi:hypothetical protein